MSNSFYRYTFEDKDGNEIDWDTTDPGEAEDYATKHGYRCFAQEFIYGDREIIWDCTGNDEPEEEAA